MHYPGNSLMFINGSITLYLVTLSRSHPQSPYDVSLCLVPGCRFPGGSSDSRELHHAPHATDLTEGDADFTECLAACTPAIIDNSQ